MLSPSDLDSPPPIVRRSRGRPRKAEGVEKRLSPATRALQVKFGVDLKQARIAAGLTQLQVAQELGTSHQTIGKAEHGRSNLTLDVMQRMAVAVRCNIVLHLNPEGGAQSVELRPQKKASTA